MRKIAWSIFGLMALTAFVLTLWAIWSAPQPLSDKLGYSALATAAAPIVLAVPGILVAIVVDAIEEGF